MTIATLSLILGISILGYTAFYTFVKTNKEEALPDGEIGGEDDDDGVLCVVCMANKRNILIEPCGHLVLCGTCYKELKHMGKNICVVCKGGVTGEKVVNF